MKLCLVRKLLGSCLLGFALGLPALARLLCAQVYVQQCFCYCILCGYYEHLRALGQNLKFYCWLEENRNKLKNKYSLLFSLSSYLPPSPFLWLPPVLAISVGGGDYARVGGVVWGNNYAVNLTEIFQLKGNEINSNQIRQSIYHSRAGESLTHTRPHPHPHTHTSTHGRAHTDIHTLVVKRKRHLAAHTKQLPAANANPYTNLDPNAKQTKWKAPNESRTWTWTWSHLKWTPLKANAMRQASRQRTDVPQSVAQRVCQTAHSGRQQRRLRVARLGLSIADNTAQHKCERFRDFASVFLANIPSWVINMQVYQFKESYDIFKWFISLKEVQYNFLKIKNYFG